MTTRDCSGKAMRINSLGKDPRWLSMEGAVDRFNCWKGALARNTLLLIHH